MGCKTTVQDNFTRHCTLIQPCVSSMIEVPVEIRNRRTEVIFLVVDGATESPSEDPDGLDLTADEFFGALPD